MSLSLVKAVALCSAVLLALPAGWCCGKSQRQDRDDAGARPACPACSQHSPAEPGPAPSKPRTNCTCDLQTAAPLKEPLRLLTGDLDDIVTAHAAPILGCEPGNVVVATPDAAGTRAGPRLHVLKCVWRC